jgi:hypothetical protein
MYSWQNKETNNQLAATFGNNQELETAGFHPDESRDPCISVSQLMPLN